MVVVSVVLRSGLAFAVASVVAASEARQSAASEVVRLAEAGSVAEESSGPASAGQFAWPASVVVAFVGDGAVGVCRSRVSGWAWAITAIHPTTRIRASFGTATPGSTPVTEMARNQLLLDMTRRFTPAGFCIVQLGNVHIAAPGNRSSIRY